MQPFAAGDQDAHIGAFCQQFCHQRHSGRRRGEQLLEIVQEQQNLLTAQAPDQAVPRRLSRAIMHAQPGQHGGRDQGRITDRRQRHETGAVAVERLELCADCQRQPRLSHSGRSDQGQQASAAPQQARTELLDLPVTSQDLRRRLGHAGPLGFLFPRAERLTLAPEIQRGRRTFAASQGSQLDQLGRQARFVLQAQRGEIVLDHRLHVWQALVTLQGTDQRAAIADGGREVVLRHAGALAQPFQEVAKGCCRYVRLFVHQAVSSHRTQYRHICIIIADEQSSYKSM